MANIVKISEKKFRRRDKKISKPKMKVTGKGVFTLQRLSALRPSNLIIKKHK